MTMPTWRQSILCSGEKEEQPARLLAFSAQEYPLVIFCYVILHPAVGFFICHPSEFLPVSGPLTRLCASTLGAALLCSFRAGSCFRAYIQYHYPKTFPPNVGKNLVSGKWQSRMQTLNAPLPLTTRVFCC